MPASLEQAVCGAGLGVHLMPPVAHGCSSAVVQQRGAVGCVKDALYCLVWTACCCCYSGGAHSRRCSDALVSEYLFQHTGSNSLNRVLKFEVADKLLLFHLSKCCLTTCTADEIRPHISD